MEECDMTDTKHIFRQKHDFYYLTLLVYVAFLALYIVVTGTISDGTVQFGFRDPVVYIIGAFILHAVIMLLAAIVRNRHLEITDTELVLRSRFNERRIRFADIERVVFARNKRKFNDGTFAVLKLHIAGQVRLLRIRVAKYEREAELYNLLRARFGNLRQREVGRRVWSRFSERRFRRGGR